MSEGPRKVLATNRRARHDYHLLETEVAGIELLGTEVKAVRSGRVNLKEAHVHFVQGEAYLVGCHISPYESAGYASHDPIRRRRLLLKKRQILRLSAKVQEKGYTVVPLEMALEGNWIKVRSRSFEASRCTTSARRCAAGRSTARPSRRSRSVSDESAASTLTLV